MGDGGDFHIGGGGSGGSGSVKRKKQYKNIPEA